MSTAPIRLKTNTDIRSKTAPASITKESHADINDLICNEIDDLGLAIAGLATDPVLSGVTIDDGYLLISGVKAKAGYADISGIARECISADFISGTAGAGHKLSGGELELTNLSVRGRITANEFLVRKVRAVGGSLMVSAGAKIEAVTSSSGATHTVNVKNGLGVEFDVDDIIICQQLNGTNQKYYKAQVTAVSADTFTFDIILGSGVPAAGDELVQVDNLTDVDRKGMIYLTNSDTNAPYLDVAYGYHTSPSNSVKVRLGRLDGIIDPDFGALAGWGLYGQNVYLTNAKFKGEIQAVAGSNVPTIDEVDDKIDNLQVGTVNLLDNSRGPFNGIDGNIITISLSELNARLTNKTATIKFSVLCANDEDVLLFFLKGSFSNHLTEFVTAGVPSRFGITLEIGQNSNDLLFQLMRWNPITESPIYDTDGITVFDIVVVEGTLVGEDWFPSLEDAKKGITSGGTNLFNNSDIGNYTGQYIDPRYGISPGNEILGLKILNASEIANKEITISLKVKSTVNSSNVFLGVFGEYTFSTEDEIYSVYGIDSLKPESITSDFKRISITGKILLTEDPLFSESVLWLFWAGGGEEGIIPPGVVTIKDIQIESGPSLSDYKISDADIIAITNKSIEDLETYVDGAFKDGIISESEAVAIEKYINSVEETMTGLTATYNQVVANPLLATAEETNLISKKSLLDSAKTNLMTSISTAIADGATTVAEKEDVDEKYVLFRTALANYNTALEAANLSITNSAAIKAAPQLDMVIDGPGIEAQGNNIVTTTDVGVWTRRVYSKIGFEGGAYVKWTVESNTAHCLIGFNFNPLAGGSENRMDYSIHLVQGSTVGYWGEHGWVNSFTYAVGDVFEIIHTGTSVKYVKNGVVNRQVDNLSLAGKIYLDVAITNIGKVSNIIFTPYADSEKIAILKRQSDIGSLVPAIEDWNPDGHSVVATPDGKNGSKSMRITAGGGQPKPFDMFAYDHTRDYLVEYWVKRSASAVDGQFYPGFHQYKSDKNTIDNGNGGFGWYKDVKNVNDISSTTWQKVSSYYLHGEAHSTTAYIRPAFLSLLGNSGGYVDVNGFVMTDVTDVLVVQNSINETSAIVEDIIADDKLDPGEKLIWKPKWEEIQSEYTKTLAQATAFAVSTSAFTTAYNTLNSYITPLLADMTTTSTIVRATFDANWKGYADAWVDITNAMATKTKTTADAAPKFWENASLVPASGYNKGDRIYQTDNQSIDGYSFVGGEIYESDTKRVGSRNMADFKLVEDASAAISQLADLANDNKLTPNEKQAYKLALDKIKAEYPVLLAKYVSYHLTTTTFRTAYNTLDSYLSPILTDLTTTSAVTGAWLRSYMNDYEAAKLALESKSIPLQGGGRNYFRPYATSITTLSGTPALSPTATGFNANGVSSFRLNSVITNNGAWTIGFEFYSGSGTGRVNIDIADEGSKTYYFQGSAPSGLFADFWFNTTDKIWRFYDGSAWSVLGAGAPDVIVDGNWIRVKHTTYVTGYGSGATYNFVDISLLDSTNYFFRNVKVESGNRATGFSVAPEDVNSALASMNAAIDDTAEKTSALTYIGSQVINTGVMMVGNGTTNTGFISGVIDDGWSSVILGVDPGGYASKATARFRVTLDGHLYATDATISGAITATSGSFSGSIYASSGTIAGFTINSNEITSYDGVIQNYFFYKADGDFKIQKQKTAGGGYVETTEVMVKTDPTNGTGMTIAKNSLIGTGTSINPALTLSNTYETGVGYGFGNALDISGQIKVRGLDGVDLDYYKVVSYTTGGRTYLTLELI